MDRTMLLAARIVSLKVTRELSPEALDLVARGMLVKVEKDGLTRLQITENGLSYLAATARDHIASPKGNPA